MTSISDIATAALPARIRNRVERTEEFERVFSLPRRGEITDEEVELMSRYLRQDPHSDDCKLCGGAGCKACGMTGKVRLRREQAAALREGYEMRGAFLPMRVGSGKTLVTFLIATLLRPRHAVLIVPSSCREKTRREFALALQNWKVTLPKIISYEILSQPDREHLLFEEDPDLVILDEAHKTRNLDASVSRRVKRFIEARSPVVIALSGTMLSDKLMDFHHHAVWALKESAPVPRKKSEAEQWAKALESVHKERARFDPGPLASVDFAAHFRESRGVVPTPGSDVECGLEIKRWAPKTKPETLALVEQVEQTKLRPDGEMLDDFEITDCLCQLSLGFYYVWDPLPPEHWLLPRRAWYAYLRAVLEEHLEGFDSPTHVIASLDHGPRRLLDGRQVLPPGYEEGRMLLKAWRAVKDTYEPNTKPVWVDAEPMQDIAKAERGTLIWTKYAAAGEALSYMGIPYYPGGTDPEGTAKPGTTLALSIAAHGTGLNMQHGWHRNRVTTPMANADAWEQLLGRTHRAGQKSDTVYVEIIESIDYHSRVMDRVYAEASRIGSASGFRQKLIDASWT